MLYPRMSRLLLQPSRRSGQSNSSTGAQLASNLAFAMSHQLMSQVVILQRPLAVFACSPIRRLFLPLGVVLVCSGGSIKFAANFFAKTISLILCTQNVPSCIGMSAKVWRKVNSLRPVRTLLHLRRIMKKLERILLMLKKMASTKKARHSWRIVILIYRLLFLWLDLAPEYPPF